MSPLRDLGQKQDATMTACADFRANDEFQAVVLLADMALAGPLFEAGWAICRGLLSVVMVGDSD